MRRGLVAAVFVVLSFLATAQQALNNSTILKMHAAGLGDDIITATISGQPGSYSTSVDDLIALKTAGVSDKVIGAMIAKNSGGHSISATSAPVDPDTAAPLVTQSPKIFITSVIAGSGGGSVTNGNGGSYFHVGDLADSVSKDIEKHCSGVRITLNQQKADYTILLKHGGIFVPNYHFQIDNREGDLVFKTKDDHTINNSTKDACTAIFGDWFGKAVHHDDPETQVEMGDIYLRSELYVPAMAAYKKAADQGDTQAQYAIALMYANGQGVPRDDKKADEWMAKIANPSDPETEFKSGSVYVSEGRYEEALALYRKSAGQGNAKAQGAIGLLYANGQGVPQDYKQALVWYRKAAELGDEEAQGHLGAAYANGDGVPVSYADAYFWMDLSLRNGDDSFKIAHDMMATHLSAGQIAEVKEREKSWDAAHPAKVQ